MMFIREIEEEQHMPYITIAECIGREEGLAERKLIGEILLA